MPIQIVNTRNVDKTSFAPGLRISSDMDLLFLSGMTARPPELDLSEPYEFSDSIEEQTRSVLENIQGVLDEAGITWREVIKIVRFYTEAGGNAIRSEYLGDWQPCSTTLGVDRLPDPGAKIMYDVTAVVPRA
ncbi:MAG: RidA family protein [Gammaproteobacteria bacterium]|jgi:enamine deaminase RidA (YjgF/YER057c/UK114 family)